MEEPQMAVRIRLARVGARNRPYYRIVVSDGRSPRDGRFIELLGTYDPRSDPPKVTLKQERVKHWVGAGATPSRTVSQLMRKVAAEAASSGS
jgi:small subunit ribosomal protein S16